MTMGRPSAPPSQAGLVVAPRLAPPLMVRASLFAGRDESGARSRIASRMMGSSGSAAHRRLFHVPRCPPIIGTTALLDDCGLAPPRVEAGERRLPRQAATDRSSAKLAASGPGCRSHSV